MDIDDAEAATREHMEAWARGEVTHPGEEFDEIDRKLEVTRRWIAEWPANVACGPETLVLRMLTKTAGEAGEALTAYEGASGYNPRKGVFGTMDDVAEELLDTALTALVAYAQVRPDGSAMRAFVAHLDSRMKRANLT